MEQENVSDIVDYYIKKLRSIINLPTFSIFEKEEEQLPEKTPEIDKYFKLMSENPDEATKYFESLPLEQKIKILNYIDSIVRKQREVQIAESKKLHLQKIKELVPELNKADEEIKKEEEAVRRLREAVQNFNSKMREFIEHKEALRGLGVSNEEIIKEIPSAQYYIEITPTRLYRFTREKMSEIPTVPERISERMPERTVKRTELIDPFTGKKYENYADFARANNIYVGSQSAHEVVLKERCDLIPASPENEKLVKDCLADPNCIKYLQEETEKTRDLAKKHASELHIDSRWYLVCNSEWVQEILKNYFSKK